MYLRARRGKGSVKIFDSVHARHGRPDVRGAYFFYGWGRKVNKNKGKRGKLATDVTMLTSEFFLNLCKNLIDFVMINFVFF